MSFANRAADSHEIRPLTGIRGLAAGLVVLFHFYPWWVQLLPSLRPCAALASRGWLGVDLFFMLSGFILSYVYSAGNTQLGFTEYRRFLWFRLARIYPNHLATLGIMALLNIVATMGGVGISDHYPVSGLPFQFTLTQAWPFLFFHPGQWNYPAWSISAEWFAYMCIFPIVWYLLRLNLRTPLALAIGYAMLVLFLWVVPAKEFSHLFQVTCEFMAGGMIFGVYLHAGWVTRVCQRYASVLFVVLVIFLSLPASLFPFAPALILLLLPLFLLGLTSEASWISKLLSTSPALWLGRVSYALYMSHAIAQRIIKVMLPPDHFVNSPLAGRMFLLFTHVVLMLLLAAALYYLVEIPMRNYLKRITRPVGASSRQT